MAVDYVDHSFDLRDSRANAGRLSGEGVHGGLDNLVDFEDAQDKAEMGDNSPLRTRNFPGKGYGDVWGRGSGETGVDMLFNDPFNTDTELVHLYREFIKDTGKEMYLDDDRTWLSLVPAGMDENEAKSEFESWINKRDAGNEENSISNKDSDSANEVDSTRVIRSGKNELWRQEDTILKTKTAIFDQQSNLKRVVEPLMSEFVKQRYFVDTIEDAIKKVEGNDLGKSASQFLIANEFLHFLKDKKRWDVVSRIDKKSSTIKKPEKKEAPKVDSLDLKLNKRRIESHLEPGVIEYLDRFVEVFGSGDVTKVRVDVKNGDVSAIKIFYKSYDGPKSVFLTKEIFHDAFDGVNYYKDSRNSDPTGLSFIDNEGDMLVLNPNTTNDEAKEIFSQISVGGKKLTGNFEVVVNKG